MIIVQQSAPDALQGRINSLVFAGLQGGPRLGDAEAGAVAELGGPQLAAWSGGLLSVATAVITCWAIPQFWRYRSTAVAGPAAPSVRPASGPGQPAGERRRRGSGNRRARAHPPIMIMQSPSRSSGGGDAPVR